DPGRVGCTPYRDEDVTAFDALLAGCRAREDRDVLSRPTVHTERLGSEETFDAFGTEDPLHFTGDVGIFAAEKPRTIVDNRHATSKARGRLAKFEADITSAEYDEGRRPVVESQRFDAGERARSFQAGNVGNRPVCADVDEDLVCVEETRSPAVQTRLQCFR